MPSYLMGRRKERSQAYVSDRQVCQQQRTGRQTQLSQQKNENEQHECWEDDGQQPGQTGSMEGQETGGRGGKKDQGEMGKKTQETQQTGKGGKLQMENQKGNPSGQNVKEQGKSRWACSGLRSGNGC
ncbi:uncharacterized protein [Procambarus clarkii]|uniref:uncharacterized protein n=1 Tax=Procambarus clarkii TaxID=6728 RepID=UPI0037436789